jgi:hypothetical protein
LEKIGEPQMNNLFFDDIEHINDPIEKFDRQFDNPRNVSEEIELLAVLETDGDYIQALLQWSDLNKVDFEDIPAMLSEPLKEKLRVQGESVGLLKRTSNQMMEF